MRLTGTANKRSGCRFIRAVGSGHGKCEFITAWPFKFCPCRIIGYETCEEEEEEGYGEEDGSSSTEEYDLEDDCEAELDEITQTLDPH
ncbi:hypothetical protein Tco_1202494 [Tanacetum coccineum]